MDWEAVIKTLGGMGAIVVAMAWLSKKLITSVLAKDLEKFKIQLQSKSDLAIEDFKSKVQLESQKRIIEYTSLHGRRAEIIAELYGLIYELYQSIQKLLFEYQHREIREDIDRKYYQEKRQDWEMKPGIHTLIEHEQARMDELSSKTRNFFEFYGRHKIYFDPGICDLIDRFSTLSSYLATNYEEIALKDNEGNLYVNPEVKRVWDKAIETIPGLLQLLENEFREILGVGTDKP